MIIIITINLIFYRVLSKLPLANQVFLRYLLPLLHHIAQHETANQMSTTNLSICFAPSLLEPDYSLAVIKNEAPSLVEFMIRHAMDIFNNELPELFRQFMGDVSESERDIKLIPIKDEEDTELSEDGYYHRHGHHHRDRSMDMGTSASEDSLDEDDMHLRNGQRPLNMIHTSSESTMQGNVGRILLGNISRTDELTDTEREDDEEDDNLSQPISFYPGGRARHKSGDSMGRRRSVSAQTAAGTMHEMQVGAYVSPPSPSRSRGYNSSSGPHGHSPMFPHRIDHDSDGSARSGNRSEPGGNGKHQKKKRKPGYSNSFSKSSDLKHSEAKLPQSSSASFYDATERPRSRSVITSTVVQRNLSDEVLDLTDRARSSNQSISSRGSGSSTGSQTQSRGTQTQPQPSSTTSLVSNRSGSSAHSSVGSRHGGTVGEIQVDPLTGKVDRDSVKQVVTNRFGIKPSEGGSSVYESPHSESPGIHSKKEEADVSKVVPRVREGVSTGYSMYSKYETRSILNRQSVVSSIDDRPEAEQHLMSKEDFRNSLSLGGGSLGRRGEMVPLGLTMSADNGSRITIGSGGYNSDTESAPSRTLNRPDKKLQEVSGPNSPSSMLPSRYSKPDSAHPLDIPSDRYLLSLDGGRGRMPSMHEETQPPANQSLTRATNKTRNDASSQPQKSTHDALMSTKSSSLEQSDSRFLDYSSSDERKLDMTVTTVTLGVKKSAEKSRSMPGYTRTRGPATSNIKTVKVVRYELPMPKKIRRINLRAYNTKK